MKVELRKNYNEGPFMFIDFNAVPRKGETICFACEPNSGDVDFLEEFYDGEDGDHCPELTVAEVCYYTGVKHPIVILEDAIERVEPLPRTRITGALLHEAAEKGLLNSGQN
jgi:hypothetical protein